jgi:hypothetical protein
MVSVQRFIVVEHAALPTCEFPKGFTAILTGAMSETACLQAVFFRPVNPDHIQSASLNFQYLTP